MIRNYLKLSMLFACIVGFASCNKESGTDDETKIKENDIAISKYLTDSLLTSKVTHETSGITWYRRVSNASGQAVVLGDAATVHLTMYLLNGVKVLSIEKDSLFTFPVGGRTTGIDGVELGALLMKSGEKASFFLPYYLAFGSTDITNIPAYSPIRLELEMVKTRTELQQIDDYIVSKQYTVSERTPDGLVLIRTNTVTGDTLGSGKSVNVKYVGKLLSGKTFDQSTSYPITTNTGGVIPGFDRAVRKMRKGEKAIAIFPSTLGYKATTNGSIGPYSSLIFELEVL